VGRPDCRMTSRRERVSGETKPNPGRGPVCSSCRDAISCVSVARAYAEARDDGPLSGRPRPRHRAKQTQTTRGWMRANCCCKIDLRDKKAGRASAKTKPILGTTRGGHSPPYRIGPATWQAWFQPVFRRRNGTRGCRIAAGLISNPQQVGRLCTCHAI